MWETLVNVPEGQQLSALQDWLSPQSLRAHGTPPHMRIQIRAVGPKI